MTRAGLPAGNHHFGQRLGNHASRGHDRTPTDRDPFQHDGAEANPYIILV